MTRKMAACPICLEPGGTEIPACPVGCRLEYHSECLRRWELHHGSECPTCRVPMRAEVPHLPTVVMVLPAPRPNNRRLRCETGYAYVKFCLCLMCCMWLMYSIEVPSRPRSRSLLLGR